MFVFTTVSQRWHWLEPGQRNLMKKKGEWLLREVETRGSQ